MPVCHCRRPIVRICTIQDDPAPQKQVKWSGHVHFLVGWIIIIHKSRPAWAIISRQLNNVTGCALELFFCGLTFVGKTNQVTIMSTARNYVQQSANLPYCKTKAFWNNWLLAKPLPQQVDREAYGNWWAGEHKSSSPSEALFICPEPSVLMLGDSSGR